MIWFMSKIGKYVQILIVIVLLLMVRMLAVRLDRELFNIGNNLWFILFD